MNDVQTIRPPLTAYRLKCAADVIAAAFLVQPESVLGLNRGKPVVAAARLALYTLLYERTNASLEEIGKRMGRHHTTVLDGIQRTTAWPEIAPAWHQALNTARSAVRL